MRDLRHPSGSRALLWIERLLFAAGAAALIWCAVAAGDAVIAQRSARGSLAAEALVATPSSTVPDETAVAPAPAPLVAGTALGAISIPRVQLSTVVLHGSDEQTLRRGPGHLENTALPGKPGNVVIAGHRDSFFWPLRNIQLGDDIFLETAAARFHYRVTSVRVVNPRDVGVLAPTSEPVLTLITCYPFWVLGSAPDRFVVRATAVDRAPPTVLAANSAGVTAGSDPVATVRPTTETAMGAVVNDDHVLVRLAVERYRLSYNERLIRHGEAGGGVLPFADCDVHVAEDEATAACSSSPEGDGTGRTFLLARVSAGWAIRTVVVR